MGSAGFRHGRWFPSRWETPPNGDGEPLLRVHDRLCGTPVRRGTALAVALLDVQI